MTAMRTTMSDRPLSIVTILERAERHHGHKTIASVESVGSLVRRTYADWGARVRRVVSILDQLGISENGVVATYAPNTLRHLEVYYAAPCSGRVMHALNTRLSATEIAYIMNHAGDEVVFVDSHLVEKLLPALSTATNLRHLVVLGDVESVATDVHVEGVEVHRYEDLLSAASPGELRALEERSPAAVAYTSGTTGNPKAVVYNHRSVYLQAMSTMTRDSLGVAEEDVVLPIVPMFHANTWGLAHASVAAGSRLVLPGADLSGAALADLIVEERVSVSAAVPTVWTSVLPHLAGRDASSLRVIVTGGAPVPVALSEAYREQTGTPLLNGWAMTETSATGAWGRLLGEERDLPAPVQAELRATAAHMAFGIEARIVNDEGEPLPWDGVASGELQVRGPWVTVSYYDDPRSDASFSADGWLRTGDVATIDQCARVRLMDRAKDLIKSGGEWISSAEIESALLKHPDVAEAAVIAVTSTCWSERPLACVVRKETAAATAEELLEFVSHTLPRWKVPDQIAFLESIPRTSVGKYSKVDLRAQFADVVLP
ncbi:fatty-acyl-CoA synthase [Marmoricola sp. URHA0025 HA25]